MIPLTLHLSLQAGVYYAFEKSDGVGKAVVVLLFLGSIFTWTIMLEKGVGLYKARKASEDFIRLFRKRPHPVGAIQDVRENFSPVARVFDSGIEKLLTFYGMSPEQARLYGSTQQPNVKLTAAEIETLRTTMEREVADQILLLEDKIGFLATTVSVSPFLGLFGTVWGVMMAFCSLASQGRADIAGLAPGVSGALLTTVVGLLVAIPSLIGYNLLTITIRKITVFMDNFVEEFMARVRLEQGENPREQE
jgi:biopolymer transport protein TolQ